MADTLTKDASLPTSEPFGMDDAINSLLDISPSTGPTSPSELEQTEEPASEPEAEAQEAEPSVQSDDELPEQIIQEEIPSGDPDQVEPIQEGPETTPERIYSVDIDGNTVRVTEDELLKGYRRQSDYTRKFQELAENRKQVDAERQQAQQIRAEYLDTIARVQQQIEASMPEYPAEHLAEVDREQYLLQAEQARQAREKMHQLEQERHRVWQEQNEIQRRQFQEHLVSQQEQMLKAIPEWQDKAVRDKESAELQSYVVNRLGYTEQEASQIYDARAVVLMRKAKAYDDMIANGGVRAKEVRRKPTVVSTSGSRAATKSTTEAAPKRLVEKASERFDASTKRGDRQDTMYAAADLLLARRQAR
jgi:hypothetical protein